MSQRAVEAASRLRKATGNTCALARPGTGDLEYLSDIVYAKFMRRDVAIRSIAALREAGFRTVENPFTLVTITKYSGAKNSALNAL